MYILFYVILGYYLKNLGTCLHLIDIINQFAHKYHKAILNLAGKHMEPTKFVSALLFKLRVNQFMLYSFRKPVQ